MPDSEALRRIGSGATTIHYGMIPVHASVVFIDTLKILETKLGAIFSRVST